MPTVEDLLAEAHDTDDDDIALAKYFAALELDFNDSRIHYNIGLIQQVPRAVARLVQVQQARIRIEPVR